MGFCSKMDNEPLIEFTPIAHQELVVITPPDHPLASKGSMVLEETLPYGQIIFKKGTGLLVIVDGLFRSIDAQPDVVYEIDENQVAAGFVANKSGICIVPDIPLLQSLDIKILPLMTPSWQRDFYLATLKDAYHPPVVEAFKRFVLAQTASM